MAADNKKSKTEKASPKEKTPAEAKIESKSESKTDAKTESKTESKSEAKTESKPETKPEPVASKYHRGEGQKPVSQAYKDNWNAIYAKKTKKR